jgi:hypothetical protein
MTSIKDAWGVSDISSTSHQSPTDRLNKSSSFFKHPNAITDSRPTRIDVALFDKDLITDLFTHTPEYRTKLVTERLTRERTTRPSPKSLSLQRPPLVKEEEEEEDKTLKEYFQIPQMQQQMQQWDSRLDLTTILLLTFLLLLLDKISTIWKNS